jgi:hypothetical protein
MGMPARRKAMAKGNKGNKGKKNRREQAKKEKKKKSSGAKGEPTKPEDTVLPPTVGKETEEMSADLAEKGIPVKESDSEDNSGTVTQPELLKLFNKNKEIAEAQKLQEADLQTRESGLQTRETDLEKRQAEAEKEDGKRNNENTELLNRQEALEHREAEAKLGFPSLRQESLDRFQKPIEEAEKAIRLLFDKTHKTILDTAEKRADASSAFAASCQEVLAGFEDSCAGKLEGIGENLEKMQGERTELYEEKETHVLKEAELSSRETALNLDRTSLDEKQRQLNELISEEAKGRVTEEKTRFDCDRTSSEIKIDALEKWGTKLQQQIEANEDRERKYGNKDPGELKAELDQKRSAVNKLQKQLDSRPTEVDMNRLASLDQENKNLTLTNRTQLAEIESQKIILQQNEHSVGSLETAERVNRGKRKQLELLDNALNEMDARYNEVLEMKQNTTPYQECSGFDKKYDTSKAPKDPEKKLDLEKLSEGVRQWMASKPKLYYTPEDVRSFIGGLAMSRLILLQGISGTGKTSLPLAFADAISPEKVRRRMLPEVVKKEGPGRGCRETIAVQAGWRDEQDLIGHYNTFERKFHETEFLKALYRASTPGFRELPFFIVLDEMNLSHPEYYFGDFISLMERPREEQVLRKFPSGLPDCPDKFVENGTALPIGENVWFFGTANHDETTMNFADKTYDRAYVCELPNQHPEPVKENKVIEVPKMNLNLLTAAFENAAEKHKKEAVKAYDWLDLKEKKTDRSLKQTLNEEFQIGWSNRLKEQALKYIPVVIACGGTAGEALDQFLVMKVLRKLKNVFGARPSQLMELRDEIEISWIDKESKPTRCLEFIDRLVKRIELGTHA